MYCIIYRQRTNYQANAHPENKKNQQVSNPSPPKSESFNSAPQKTEEIFVSLIFYLYAVKEKFKKI